jgi:hypothetical protein
MKTYKEHAQSFGYVAQQALCSSKWFWYNDKTEQLSEKYFPSEEQAYKDATYVSLLKSTSLIKYEDE